MPAPAARIRSARLPCGTSSSSIALTSNWFNHDKTVESVVGQVFSDWTDTFSTEFKASYRDYAAIRVPPTTAPTIQVYFDDGVTGNGNDSPIGTNSNSFSGLDAIRLGTERSRLALGTTPARWKSSAPSWAGSKAQLTSTAPGNGRGRGQWY